MATSSIKTSQLMKVIITTLIFILPLLVNAQLSNQQETSVFTKERIQLSVGFGSRINFGTSGNMTTNLESKADFSNYTHQYVVSENIQKPIILMACQVEMAYTHAFGLSHAMQLDIAFGQNSAFFGGYSVGWEIPLASNKNGFSLQPGFSFMLGYSKHYIGQLNRFYGDFPFQDFDPIQIEDSQYFGDRLSVHITQDQVALIYGPELALNFIPPTSKVGLRFSTGYYLSGSESEAIIIFDQFNNDFPEASSLTVHNPVLDVFHNGRLLTKNPFNYGGLHANLSVVFDF